MLTKITFIIYTQNNQPDYDQMQTLISAIQKLVIKDVLEYAKARVRVTSGVVQSA